MNGDAYVDAAFFFDLLLNALSGVFFTHRNILVGGVLPYVTVFFFAIGRQPLCLFRGVQLTCIS
jgi:hypothetical protein